MECVNIVGVTRGTLHSALGGGEVDKAKSSVIVKGYKIRRVGILLG